MAACLRPVTLLLLSLLVVAFMIELSETRRQPPSRKGGNQKSQGQPEIKQSRRQKREAMKQEREQKRQEKQKKARVESQKKDGNFSPSVMDLDLVSEEVKYKTILDHHDSYCKNVTHKHFDGDALAYVTPWNNHGYDVAKWFNHKFNYVSPVWFNIRIQQGEGGGSYVQGEHDVDQGWMDEVRGSHKTTKIYPRFMFDAREGFGPGAFAALFKSPEHMEGFVAQIVGTAARHPFDGIVLEMWSQAIRVLEKLRPEAIEFVKMLSAALKKQGMKLILVIPPPPPKKYPFAGFTREDFMALHPHVERFSLVSYDFSTPNSGPGPNSPLTWVESIVRHLTQGMPAVAVKKLLVGVPMYANDLYKGGGDLITSEEVLSLLTRFRPKVEWANESQEHFFTYTKNQEEHSVYFPSLKMIDMRLKFAKEMGVGVALWEVGQGLDYFYDLF